MDDILKAVLLGILEGITEFLPISSTGHLIIGTQLLNFRPELQGTFEIFIQAGAIVAVLIYYARDLLYQAQHSHETRVQQWWLAVIVAAVPGLALGFLLADTIEEVLFRPSVVAVSMIVGGIFIYVAEIYQRRQVAVSPLKNDLESQPILATASSNASIMQTQERHLESDVSVRQALVIGLFQVLALFPGMSRSAMSIIGGMFAGLPRPIATRFSFYLAIPVLGSATVYSLVKNLSNIQADDMFLLVVGAVVSGLVAWIVIAWLLRYVARHSFIPFAMYRILVGVLILMLVASGLLT